MEKQAKVAIGIAATVLIGYGIFWGTVLYLVVLGIRAL